MAKNIYVNNNKCHTPYIWLLKYVPSVRAKCLYTNTQVRVYTHFCASTNASLFLFSTSLQLILCLYTNFSSLYTNTCFSRRATPFCLYTNIDIICRQAKKRVYNPFVEMSKKGKYTHICVSTNFDNLCVYKLFCVSTNLIKLCLRAISHVYKLYK